MADRTRSVVPRCDDHGLTIAGIRRFYAVAAGLAAIAGVLLFPLANETDTFFSWDVEPPLTAAFLGAAYWAALVLLAWAAVQRSWGFARTAMPPVATIAALLLVTTIAHLDRFDMDSLFGWFWLVVYALVTPLLAWLLFLQSRTRAPVARGAAPLPGALRAALAAQALVLLAFGAALLIAPLDVADLWPWELTALTGRAVGSFLTGFGIAAAFALWEDDVVRLRGVATAYATLAVLELLALAIFAADVTANALGVALYVLFWAAALALGASGAALASARAARAASGSR